MRKDDELISGFIGLSDTMDVQGNPVFIMEALEKITSLNMTKFKSTWPRFEILTRGHMVVAYEKNYYGEEVWRVSSNSNNLLNNLYTCIVECIKRLDKDTGVEPALVSVD